MPTPRRRIHTFVTDANGIIPVYRSPLRAEASTKRCERCSCILASDNIQPFCSPCQRKLGGMPDHFDVYASDRPRRY